MPSATADTNIYISGLLFGGVPRRFLDLAAAGDFRLDISDAILSETLRVLRDKFQWTAGALREAKPDIRGYTKLSVPTQTLDVIQSDPFDKGATFGGDDGIDFISIEEIDSLTDNSSQPTAKQQYLAIGFAPGRLSLSILWDQRNDK